MPFNSPLPPAPVPTWVVFCDAPHVWWLKPLARGFRHCFVVQRHAKHFVTLDPLFGQLEIMIHPATRGFDLIQTLKDHGLTIVPFERNQKNGSKSFSALCTCVTITKRVLGIHAPFIQTPYGLYRTLMRRASSRENQSK